MKIKKGFYKQLTNRLCEPEFHWTGMIFSALGRIHSFDRQAEVNTKNIDQTSPPEYFIYPAN